MRKAMTMRHHLSLGCAGLVFVFAAAACGPQGGEPVVDAQALSNSPTAGPVPRSAVEAQPLGANIERLLDALDYLGAPVSPALRRELSAAARARSAEKLQQLLDDRV